MRTNISTASEVIQSRHSAKLRDGGIIHDVYGRYITKSNALAWLEAARCAWGFGFDVDAPPTPLTAERERLMAETSPLLNEFNRVNALELDEERKAVTAWEAMRRWATEPSPAESAAAVRAEFAKRREAEALEKRTAEILATDEAKRVEIARKKARVEAEREIAS